MNFMINKIYTMFLEKIDDLDKDENLAHLSDIEEYKQGVDNFPFYDYYKKLYPFDKNEERKIKEKVKSIEGMRRIL